MTALDGVLFNLAFWHWLTIAIIFGALEMAAPGVVFLWLAVAAGGVGLIKLAAPDLSPTIQLALFAGLSIVSVPLGRRLFRPDRRDPDAADALNRRGAAMIGEIGRLEADTVDGRGRAFFGETAWAVRMVEGRAAAKGAAVVVVSVTDDQLMVAPQGADGPGSSDDGPPSSPSTDLGEEGR